MKAEEKLEKIKKMADAMYYAAANLGPTVGSGEHLRKTMEEYHKFIIHEYHKEEPSTSVWHDASETPKMYCKYLIRYADGRVNGSWERHDDGFIPWKDVVKEHKFTHWCYVEDLLKL